MAHDVIFDRAVAKFDIIEKIHFHFVIGNRVFIAFLTEVVDNQVMGDTGNPCLKLTVFGITALFDSHNHLDKSLLKDIIRQIFIAHHKIYIRIDTALVTVQQHIKGSIITLCIKDNQLKEEIRLFYVALTRAKQLMYVTATVSESKSAGFGVTAKLGGAGCDLDFISSAVFDGTVKCMPFRHYADEDDVQKAQPDTFQLVPDENIVNAALSAQAFVYPHKQATALAMKYSVSALDSKDDDAIEVFEEAAKRGTAYHKVMQYIDYAARGAEEVEKQMDELVNRNILTKEEKETVNPQDVAKCLESDIMKVALEAENKGKCHREQSFLMYKKDKVLSEEAEKRLKAIREFTEFGAGIRIAMRDLEIRGAGNVLGAEQHGEMQAVGYDLYCKLLSQAVKLMQLKGEMQEDVNGAAESIQTSIDCNADAYIPGEYISDEYHKLDIYKRIAEISTEAEYRDMQDELIDRYGDIPKATETLLRIALLKAEANNVYVTEISIKDGGMTMRMDPKADINVEAIPELIKEANGRLKFIGGGNPKFVYQVKRGEPKDADSIMEYILGMIKALKRN